LETHTFEFVQRILRDGFNDSFNRVRCERFRKASYNICKKVKGTSSKNYCKEKEINERAREERGE
jgi:hypothetical protein